MSFRQLPPLDPPSPFPLPISKVGFDEIVQIQRKHILDEYLLEREKYINKILKSTAEQRKFHSPEQRQHCLEKLHQDKNWEYYCDEDPFKAEWLPHTSDLPAFPPREVYMAQVGHPPVPPTTDVSLRRFIASGERLLTLTLTEMMETPFLDAFIFRYALVRWFDFPVSARRFLCFRRLLFDHKEFVSFRLDDDMRRLLAVGGDVWSPTYADLILSPEKTIPKPDNFEENLEKLDDMLFPETARTERLHERTPIIFTRPRLVVWGPELTPQRYCKVWFYFATLTVCTDYFAQAIGIVIVGSAKGMGYANVCRDFQNFTIAVIKEQCLPLRLHRVFAANENFLIHNILWPIARKLMSNRTAKKMVFLGSKYNRLLEEVEGYRLPKEVGGTFDLPEDGMATLIDIETLLQRAA